MDELWQTGAQQIPTIPRLSGTICHGFAFIIQCNDSVGELNGNGIDCSS
jgi:hypothetical protein